MNAGDVVAAVLSVVIGVCGAVWLVSAAVMRPSS